MTDVSSSGSEPVVWQERHLWQFVVAEETTSEIGVNGNAPSPVIYSARRLRREF